MNLLELNYSTLHLHMGYVEIISQYILRRRWLGKPIPHMKYTGTIYPYIPSSGHYVNPSLAQPIWSYLLMTTSCVEVVNMCVFHFSACDTWWVYLNWSKCNILYSRWCFKAFLVSLVHLPLVSKFEGGYRKWHNNKG